MSHWDRARYPVVYSTGKGDYRRATVEEVARQKKAQYAQADAWARFKDDGKPDALDRWWAEHQEFVSMISRSPHGVKHTRHNSQLLRTRHAAVDTLLTKVPRGYGEPDGRIKW